MENTINKLAIEYRNQTNIFKTVRFTIPNESIIGILQNLGVLDQVGMRLKDRLVFGGAKANVKNNKMTVCFAAADIPPGPVDISKQRELESELAKQITESLKEAGSNEKMTKIIDKILAELSTVKSGFSAFFTDKSLQAVFVPNKDLFEKAKLTLNTFNALINDLNNLKGQVGELSS